MSRSYYVSYLSLSSLGLCFVVDFFPLVPNLLATSSNELDLSKSLHLFITQHYRPTFTCMNYNGTLQLLRMIYSKTFSTKWKEFKTYAYYLASFIEFKLYPPMTNDNGGHGAFLPFSSIAPIPLV